MLIVLVLGAPGADAYRPFVSTDASVADRGEVEVEFGYIGFRRDGSQATSRTAGRTTERGSRTRPSRSNGWPTRVRSSESATESGADNSALVGAIWKVGAPAPIRALSLDGGVRHGISAAADEWGGTAGFTIAFPVWGEGDTR